MYFGTPSQWRSIFSFTAVQSLSTFSPIHLYLLALLFVRLTYIFAGSKGIDYHEIKDTLDNMIKDLELEDKRHTRAGALSGGQKRKLQLAIAFIGNNKVIFLGMYQRGRREAKRLFMLLIKI